MTAKVANKQGTVVVGEKRREEAKAKLGLPNIGDATPVAYILCAAAVVTTVPRGWLDSVGYYFFPVEDLQ